MDFEVAYYRMNQNNYFANQIELNEELFNELSKYMNPDYSITEQIIYYYIMIAKTVTYDPQFYASEQKGVPALLHEDPSNVVSITPNNNECVCYETAAILEKILEKYGLEYEVLKSHPHIYGQEHTCTKFIVDKYIVCGDILSHSFLNDAFYAKLGLPLQSLQCINQNEESRSEFQGLVERVYKDINDKTLSPNIKILRDILKVNKKKMPYEERVKILAQLGHTGEELPMMDRFAVLKFMYLTSFTAKEMTDNIRLVMAKEMVVENVRIYGFPVALVALNPNSLEQNPEQSYYFGFDRNFNFSLYDRNTLQSKFDGGTYSYLSYFDQSRKIGNYAKLPGIAKPKREY
jgi:hypothetical protein